MSDLAPLEIWASPEPTVARVAAATVRDQLAETGHERRPGDVALLAGLGVAATRYPVLWEKTAPDDPARLDLTWARARLEALRAAGLEPIVTLLHHGSGPAYTGLVDPAFPQLLAEYAGHVARAFPWVRRWTPINEPLTTARFATLYGLWYPNRAEDHPAFGAAIANEALGILLAMERIRAAVPGAELVITEDLQRFTAADAPVGAYVAHKRERMYLSLELVMGRVVPGHALYAYLTETCNVPRARLREIAERAAPPGLVGFNYYPHSERYLFTARSGAFENLAAVYVEDRALSPLPMLRAAHERLGLPLALSEVHVRGTARERVRWLLARHADALALRAEGVPLRALGAWAAFGMVDWHSLLLRRDRVIEDGVFTFAPPGAAPEPTAVASAVAALAAGAAPEAVDEPGWWERDERRLSVDGALALRAAGRPEGDHLVAAALAR